MIEKDDVAWVIPTFFGLIVSLVRGFRRKQNETHKTAVLRLLVHSTTCVLLGYIVSGALIYFGHARAIGPACALSGLYGSIIVDWIEDNALPFLSAYLQKRINK